jgi:hypothetical protein
MKKTPFCSGLDDDIAVPHQVALQIPFVRQRCRHGNRGTWLNGFADDIDIMQQILVAERFSFLHESENDCKCQQQKSKDSVEADPRPSTAIRKSKDSTTGAISMPSPIPRKEAPAHNKKLFWTRVSINGTMQITRHK